MSRFVFVITDSTMESDDTVLYRAESNDNETHMQFRERCVADVINTELEFSNYASVKLYDNQNNTEHYVDIMSKSTKEAYIRGLRSKLYDCRADVNTLSVLEDNSSDDEQLFDDVWNDIYNAMKKLGDLIGDGEYN